MKGDERRSAKLLFDRELSSGAVALEAIERSEVAAAVRSRPVPPRAVRRLEQLALRRGRLDHGRAVGRLVRARRSVLGARADASPRVLVRVDEFPHPRSFDEPARYGPAAFERFHAILRDAGVPYLLAVTPRLARDYLDPAASGGRALDERERDVLARLRADGVELGLHGYDHRARSRRRGRRSELAGLGGDELASLLATAAAALWSAGISPRVFVPPFNHFAADQYDSLAARFEVVCGGPESVGEMGFQPTPLWRGDAVYMPAYAPLYARAGEIDSGLERLATHAPPWLPVVLHWGWELDDGFSELERLAPRLAPMAVPWSELHAAIGRSR